MTLQASSPVSSFFFFLNFFFLCQGVSGNSVIKLDGKGVFSNELKLARAEDKFAWLRDDEFGRQAVAGINPVNIERVKVISNNFHGQFRHS